MKWIRLAIVLSCIVAQVQAQEVVYLLVRHAEKDTSQTGSTMMMADPALTTTGHARAKKLAELYQKEPIQALFSSNFQRTKSTLAPLAEKKGLQIQTYNHRELQALANQLLEIKNGWVVVAGHSNTTPSLVNLLLKENKFEPFDESNYNTYFIVRRNKDKFSVEKMEYPPF